MNKVVDVKSGTTYTNSLKNMKKFYYNKGFRNGILVGLVISLTLYLL